ncbi:peptidase MA family metallohydrolase [Pelosinus sp. sgz500959]|uniref:peptidase MA family metallohydrolase n=1 Tax=Pelosinus sp. sgz500959 TaxID=3242472 RepID=UPI00366EA2DA
MRNIMIEETTLFIVICGLVMLLIVSSTMPFRPQMWVYPLARYIAYAKVDVETRHMPVYETDHFRIKYTQSDADTVHMIAEAAESAYGPVTHELGYAPQGKTLILVQPSKSELRRAFGWSGNESAMGVYWGGVIQLLSPHVWLTSGDSVEEFIHSGPMVHEYTHLVFDYLTNGNYPRWFTEGLAQYMEYLVNGYEWQTKTNALNGKLYTMTELDGDFDHLPNQSLAYRQSLAAVRYISEVYGDDALQGIVADLKNGQGLQKAIQRRIGLDYPDFESSWQRWAVINMDHYTENH